VPLASFCVEVIDVLLALRAEGGSEDPTFRRMVDYYRKVAEVLGQRAAYDAIVAGVLQLRPPPDG
jgi:hypothetical protein